MKYVSLALALAGVILIPRNTRAQFADAVVSYNSGTGFAAGFTNPNTALGAPSSGPAITPFAAPFAKTQLVSIGAGGEITLQMSSPILNDPTDAYGLDFIIFANQFFISRGGIVNGLYDHPASILVQVSQDDSSWFTLDPSLAPQPGTLYPTAGNGDPNEPVNPGLTLGDLTGQTLAGVDSLYAGADGGTGYDLSWAEDSLGNNANLASADYVRIEVQTGVLDLDAVSVVPDSFPTIWLVALGTFGLFWLRSRQGKMAALLFTLSLASLSSRAATVTFSDSFTNDPAQTGWRTFGDASLFQWDSTNHDVAVTWDSSISNSYLYHPLGTILTRNDDFTISFDLLVNDAVAYNYGFELCLGLLNLDEATSSGYDRSTGLDSPDLVEFDYFPNVDFGATVWPLFVDSTSTYNYNDASDFAIYAPNLADWYHIVMAYSASNQTMVTTMTNAEQTTGVTIIDPLADYFGDFYVNTISIESYKDDGGGDSIYAHGAVRNISVTFPGLPIQNLAQGFTNGVWQAQFCSLTNWLYTLQRSTDLQTWNHAGPATAGNATNLFLIDSNPPPAAAYYRISASRP